jgi:hypothetical protein
MPDLKQGQPDFSHSGWSRDGARLNRRIFLTPDGPKMGLGSSGPGGPLPLVRDGDFDLTDADPADIRVVHAALGTWLEGAEGNG